MKPRFKHEPLIDLTVPPPPQPKPVPREPEKKQPYDSLYLKLKYDRDYFTE